MASLISTQAIEKWGEESQRNKAVEELGELITALMRFANGRGTKHDVVTEIADCYIMLDQLRHMFGEDDVEDEIVIKENRLMELLAKSATSLAKMMDRIADD